MWKMCWETVAVLLCEVASNGLGYRHAEVTSVMRQIQGLGRKLTLATPLCCGTAAGHRHQKFMDIFTAEGE